VSSSVSAPPSLPSSSLPSSSSLSGAPKALAGLLPGATSLPGAAKLESFGPEPPVKPLPSADPKTLPLPSPPKPDGDALPKPNPDAGLSPDRPPKPVSVVVEVELGDFAPASALNPEVID
jgi:hypothetical protein